MEAIQNTNRTFNPKRCIFGKSGIKFWSMLFTSEGVKPDPGKFKVFENSKPPKDKDELKSFICMMQSNSDFIPSFAKVVAPLQKLLNEESFCSTYMHQKTFDKLLKTFSDNLLLSDFDMTLPSYIFTDAHKTGLGAILYQGKDFESLKPVVITSRCSNQGEKNYEQLDLEAMAIDLSLRGFRLYLLTSPKEPEVIMDHFPLIRIFNGTRFGSIATEKIKLRHQDIKFYVIYRKGKYNPNDYIKRHVVSCDLLNKFKKKESDNLTNLLYTLHVSPVIYAIGIKEIAEYIAKDSISNELRELIKSVKNYIPESKPNLNP